MRAIVIGGGISGCATAYALAKRGIAVTLLERHSALCSEASGNPSAMLYPRLSGSDDLSSFAFAGFQHSVQLFETLGLSTHDFQECGMLQLGFNPRELARIEKVAKTYEAQGICQLLSPVKASEQAGIGLLYPALYFREAGWIKPIELQHQLTQHKNISTKTSTTVSNLLKINSIYKIYDTNQNVHEAEIVVIANANDAHHFQQSSHIDTQANRGQISLFNTSALSSHLRSVICSDGYLSPTIDGVHSLGASYSKEDTSLTLRSTDHQHNLQKLASISPHLYQAFKEQEIVNPAQPSGRVSFRCTTPDYFPLLGQLLDSTALQNSPPRPNALPASLPWLHGLFINVGHGSKGFTTAPLCAEILAALICNTPLPVPADLVSLLNPNRFLLRSMGLKRLAKTVAISS